MAPFEPTRLAGLLCFILNGLVCPETQPLTVHGRSPTSSLAIGIRKCRAGGMSVAGSSISCDTSWYSLYGHGEMWAD